MSTLLTLLGDNAYLDFPKTWLAWVVAGISWLVLLGVVLGLLRRWRAFNKPWTRARVLLFVLLLLLTPPACLFLGLRFQVGSALPLKDLPLEPQMAFLMFLAAVPWALAAGILGPLASALIAFAAGLIQAFWGTHSLFTPLEMSLLAIIFSMLVNQRYRSWSFRLLSFPLAAALFVTVLYPPIFLLTASLNASGPVASRLDYALTHLSGIVLALGGELVIAGIFASVAAAALTTAWGSHEPLRPSPAESSLQARFLYSVAPAVVTLVVALMVVDWIVAENAARRLLSDRMTTAVQTAAQGITPFLETGQGLITRLAEDKRLLAGDPATVRLALEENLDNFSFFTQLYVVDEFLDNVTGAPERSYSASKPTTSEQAGLQLSLAGVPYQYYVLGPHEESAAAQVSFLAVIRDANAVAQGILVGRTDVANNTFTHPIISSLESLDSVGGEGVLLDENGQILYHSTGQGVMDYYRGKIPEEADFFDETAPDGTRRLVLYQPDETSSWSVVATVPARYVQQVAVDIAAPLLGVLAALGAVSVILLRLGLGVITRSLKKLAVEAGNISQGQLEQPLQVTGDDEAGQLGRAFEQMRVSLKSRLEELNQLLLVSKGVASSLDFSQAVRPLLTSALRSGASSARVVLDASVVPEMEGDGSDYFSLGAGGAGERYAYLDEQVLVLGRQQDRLVMPNLQRPRLLRLTPGFPRPDTLVSLALRHENQYYGVLWVAYDQPHPVSDEDLRFLTTLAGQAALAAANARLFLNAEVGRQRLAAILASTPDPVLVTDQQNRLLVANPAVWQVLGLGIDAEEGQPIEKVVSHKDLLALLLAEGDDHRSVEITLHENRVYYATASTVMADGQRVGRVCVLRDITSFKELNTLKSEFVSAVSHDLRSPLTLMRGYATMLEMVGPLNDQQVGYVRKIIGGVENMSRMVSNLLDLSRIETGVGLQLQLVSVQDVISQAIGELQPQANQKKIQLSAEIPDQTIPLVEADPALLQQALHNLIENAVKYTAAAGTVRVVVRSRQERMQFEIHDSGIGIAPVDQPRLFEKFYRGGQQGGKVERGSGLGLAIVKSIVERHHGQVWVESQLGKGSTFYFAIPVRQPKPEPQAAH